MYRQDTERAEPFNDKAKPEGQGAFSAFAVLCVASVVNPATILAWQRDLIVGHHGGVPYPDYTFLLHFAWGTLFVVLVGLGIFFALRRNARGTWVSAVALFFVLLIGFVTTFHLEGVAQGE